MSASEDTAMAARLTMLANLDDQLAHALAATRRLRLGYDALAALVRAEFPPGLSLAEIAGRWRPDFGADVTDEQVQALRDIEAADEAGRFV